MSNQKQGRQTLRFSTAPMLIGWGNVAGKKEGEGPLGGQLDELSQDDTFGQKTWEKAECVMQQRALVHALARGGRKGEQLDVLLAGDLVNQCICSSFAARQQQVPFLGLYGACSTMGESLLLCAVLVDAGYADLAAAVTSSHFCTAERPVRPPLQDGGR
ncbi:MAG: stage V sporulation protein AD, partial [Oscillospiraceae bacterium]|nr:stage V sporulation protein AD [Oscillospiraceae bacterium]